MTITTSKELKEKIAELELRKSLQQAQLKQAFTDKVESFKPLNLAKSGMRYLSSEPILKDGILDYLIGLGVNAITKKIFIGSSPSFLKRILGNIAQKRVARAVSEHTDPIKNAAYGIMQKIFS